MVDFTLDPSETAFVFIEFQNEFTTEGGKLHDAVKDVMEKTNSKRVFSFCFLTRLLVIASYVIFFYFYSWLSHQ